MADLLDLVQELWTGPVDADPAAAAAAFGRAYTDPVLVNGSPMSLVALAGRARALHRAFDGLSMQILDRVDTADRLVIAFLMRGRQVGDYSSPLGTVPPTGRDIEVRTIDVLTLRNGLIAAVWVVADELGMLTQLGAVRLSPG